jgi:hypothetical protein
MTPGDPGQARADGQQVFSLVSVAPAPGRPVPDMTAYSQAVTAFVRGDGLHGEVAYQRLHDQMERERELWLETLPMEGNSVIAERLCGILGTLATAHRQRGTLPLCERVLELESHTLRIYRDHIHRKGDNVMALDCYNGLEYKYNLIRFNVAMETGAPAGALLRALCEHEIKYGFTFDQQNFLYVIEGVLGRKPTLQNVRALTDRDAVALLRAVSNFTENPLRPTDEGPEKRIEANLTHCAHCKLPASEERKLKACSRCHTRRYCSTECQRRDWALHRKECQPKDKQ